MKKLLFIASLSILFVSCSSHKHCDAYGKAGLKKDKPIKSVSL